MVSTSVNCSVYVWSNLLHACARIHHWILSSHLSIFFFLVNIEYCCWIYYSILFCTILYYFFCLWVCWPSLHHVAAKSINEVATSHLFNYEHHQFNSGTLLFTSCRSHSGQAQAIRKMSERLAEFRELHTGDVERSSLNTKHYAHMFTSSSSSSSSSSSDVLAAKSSGALKVERLVTKNVENLRLSSRHGFQQIKPEHRVEKQPQRITKAVGEGLVELTYEACTQDYTVSKFLSLS